MSWALGGPAMSDSDMDSWTRTYERPWHETVRDTHRHQAKRGLFHPARPHDFCTSGMAKAAAPDARQGMNLSLLTTLMCSITRNNMQKLTPPGTVAEAAHRISTPN